jgi:hypothetical protein
MKLHFYFRGGQWHCLCVGWGTVGIGDTVKAAYDMVCTQNSIAWLKSTPVPYAIAHGRNCV